MKLTFATGNAGKFAEARAVLEPLGHTLEQWDRGYPELQADTLGEVARAGVDALAGVLEPPFFLEDAGLFVDALGGFPGVYSSYVHRTLGWEGVLKLLDGVDDRGARFEAVIGFAEGKEVRLVRGVCPGTIAAVAAGEHGFGFDPVFVPEGHARTFAEMDVHEKAPLSHRGRALAAFVALLEDR